MNPNVSSLAGAGRTGPSRETTYRAVLSIMVLAFRDNHDAAVTIPPGEFFDVIGPAPDDRFTIVSIKGEDLLVFNSDLEQRAQLVHEESHRNP
jgi:hypothetical protein